MPSTVSARIGREEAIVQRGDRNSLASQPMASFFIGSMATETFSVLAGGAFERPLLKPARGNRAKAILCLHTGHIGQSLIASPMTISQDHRRPDFAFLYLIKSQSKPFSASFRSVGTAGEGAS